MTIAFVAAVALMGSTTWLAQNQELFEHDLARRLTGAGLALSLATILTAVIAAVAAQP